MELNGWKILPMPNYPNELCGLEYEDVNTMTHCKMNRTAKQVPL